jgi:hypothetical protein
MRESCPCFIEKLDWDFISHQTIKNEEWKNFFITHPDLPGYLKMEGKYWNWNILSQIHPLDLIFECKDWPWNWIIVGKNLRQFKPEWWLYIRENPTVPWNYKMLSHVNLKIPDDIFIKNSEKEWDLDALSSNNRIPLNIVSKYPEKKWNWASLSNHEDLDWRTVVRLSEKEWDWAAILTHDFSLRNSAIIIQRAWRKYKSKSPSKNELEDSF